MKNFITIVTVLSLFFVSSFPVHGMNFSDKVIFLATLFVRTKNCYNRNRPPKACLFEQILQKIDRTTRQFEVEKIEAIIDSYPLWYAYYVLRTYGINRQTGSGGYTLLHRAVDQGNLKRATLLLTSGAKVNANDRQHSETPLFMACSQGKLDIAKLLISNGADIHFSDRWGRRLLHAACYPSENPDNNKPGIISLLIEKGAKINFVNNNGETPLYIACFYNNHRAVEELLKYNPDLSIKPQDKPMLLQQAHINNHSKIITLLSDHITKYIFPAAEKCNLNTVKKYFDPIWDFSQTDAQKNTIFHLLFCNPDNDSYYWDVLDKFLKSSEIPDGKKFFNIMTASKNAEGLTPIALASQPNNFDLGESFKQLFYVKTFGNLRRIHGVNGADHESRYPDNLKNIINAGVNVNIPIDYRYSTLLHEACSSLLVDVKSVREILQKGGLVNAINFLGNTPLHCCRSNEKALLLIQHGAQVNIYNKKGETPFIIENNISDKQICTLVDHGAWVDKIFDLFDHLSWNVQKFILENGDLKPEEFAYTVPDDLPMIKASDHAQNECISTNTVSCSLRTFCIRKLVRTKSLQAQQDFLHAMAHPDLCDHIIDYLATYIAKTPGTLFLKKMFDPVPFLKRMLAPVYRHSSLVSPYLQSIKGNVSDAVFLTSLHQKIIDNKVPEKYAKKAATFKIEVMVPYADSYTEGELIQLRKDAVMNKVQLPLSLLPALEWKK